MSGYATIGVVMATFWISPYLIALHEDRVEKVRRLPMELFVAILIGVFWPLSWVLFPYRLNREFE